MRLLEDTLAIGAAAVNAPGDSAILQTARLFGNGTEARLIGTQERLPAPSAAFVNGYRIHNLEWDAVHEPAVVHAMSVVTAALGAAIDRRGNVDREEALVALAIGVDIASGLGLCVDSAMRFFRPAICGVMGAAVAVARVDGAPLDDAPGHKVAIFMPDWMSTERQALVKSYGADLRFVSKDGGGFLGSIAVCDGDAILMAQKLCQSFGLDVGISSGANPL